MAAPTARETKAPSLNGDAETVMDSQNCFFSFFIFFNPLKKVTSALTVREYLVLHTVGNRDILPCKDTQNFSGEERNMNP